MRLAFKFATPALLVSAAHGFILSPSFSKTFTAAERAASSVPFFLANQGVSKSKSKPNTPNTRSRQHRTLSMSVQIIATSSWDDLKASSAAQPIGSALNNEIEVRKSGRGSPHVGSKLRLFDADESEQPKITFYRDHAGE
jgi:hypothetical protein